MKKFLPVPVIFLLAFIACKKTGNSTITPAPVYSVTADINGASTSFSAKITVDTSSTPGTIYIVAHSDTLNFTPLLEITLTGTSAITAGAYPDTVSNGRQGLLGYTGWNSNDTAYQYTSTTDTVTVTSVSKMTLAGTFQGTCQYFLDSTVTITNGKFTVGLGQQ